MSTAEHTSREDPANEFAVRANGPILSFRFSAILDHSTLQEAVREVLGVEVVYVGPDVRVEDPRHETLKHFDDGKGRRGNPTRGVSLRSSVMDHVNEFGACITS